ncbi:glycosyltransferase [Aminithiophilus ramosus]|uniref:Glycosyltransferase n=1 Tax=Aminithiophilus ramosus TaxID=3029084 RepID=A0A9Q7EYD6_9BACT|nr:glycosyltransferase [Aminithiophilus ramosus]QTX31901.1 glycosyltransferase [Aminithiophilus ramosus]
MKILLIGEYSGLHNNLSEGLLELGHEVTIASSGDGWKNFHTDIALSKTHFKGRLGKIESKFNLFRVAETAANYDIIQLISYKQVGPYLNPLFIKKLFNKNPNIFILATGSSPITTKYQRKNFPYCPFSISREEIDSVDCSDVEKFIKQSKNPLMILEEKKCLKYAKKIIPTSISYLLPYQNASNCIKDFIPMPINTKKYQNVLFDSKKNNGKIKILYGLSRGCLKGHVHIKKALDKIQEIKLKNIEITIINQVSFNNYVSLVRDCDFLIDQCKSYSYGMNALLGLAMGKIVFSGAENSIKEQLKNCPIVNINPDHLDIYNKIMNLIENSDEIICKKKQALLFVQENHDYINIAKKYLNIWTSNM